MAVPMTASLDWGTHSSGLLPLLQIRILFSSWQYHMKFLVSVTGRAQKISLRLYDLFQGKVRAQELMGEGGFPASVSQFQSGVEPEYFTGYFSHCFNKYLTGAA